MGTRRTPTCVGENVVGILQDMYPLLECCAECIETININNNGNVTAGPAGDLPRSGPAAGSRDCCSTGAKSTEINRKQVNKK